MEKVGGVFGKLIRVFLRGTGENVFCVLAVRGREIVGDYYEASLLGRNTYTGFGLFLCI